MTSTDAVWQVGRWVLLVSMLAVLGRAPMLAAQERGHEPTFLLLEVRLDQTVLSDAIPAYDVGEHTLLPLGELARLLTIAIQTMPGEGTARGFVLSEDRGFSLSVGASRVTRAGVTESFEPQWVLVEPDDIYVAEALLERWLPIELEVDRSRLTLRVHALETLPLQARLARERIGERAATRGGDSESLFPHHELPYRLLSVPSIDQNIATELRRDDAGIRSDTRYSAYLTGDALGMEAALYASSSQRDPSPDIRATLGRHDPDAGLLGPLKARTVQFGSVTASSVEHVTRGLSGEGVTLSNRPLTQPTRFDSQTFEGDLPPGWDVELYYNDALVGFQRAPTDGRYRFEDQPLSYGRNDFRLVFHGPLGQTRIEQSSYSLAQSMARPGELRYAVTGHRGDDSQSRAVAQVDLGLARHVSATATFIRAPVAGTERQFTSLGMRTFWQALSVSGNVVTDGDGGTLSELGVQTRLGGVAVDAGRVRLHDFASDVYHASADPIRSRDEIRLSGAVPVSSQSRLPVALEVTRDERASGASVTDVSARVSAYVRQTAFTNNLRWHASGTDAYTAGSLRVSRRVRNTSVRGQIDYRLASDNDISALALSADKALSEGYRVTLGVARNFVTPQTRYTTGFTKTLGRYGLGLNASYLSSGEIAVGAQLLVGLGRDPQRSGWLLDAQSVANRGAASVRLFLDENNNGLMDSGEEPLPGAGFTVNGSRHEARTDAHGIARLDRLPVKQHVDIGVDTATLEDPQWAPQIAGRTLVPRPGRVAELQFPVRMTSEIDGTVYLYEDGSARGIGDMKLELLNQAHEIVAEIASSWDGFYILPGVPAGDYWLRVSPAQLKRLRLLGTGTRAVTVPEDGSFVSGIDMHVLAPSRPAPARLSGPDSRRPGASEGGQSPRFRTERWVRAQPSGSYTIQLMAAGLESRVRQYIERNHLTQHAGYARTTHNGAPWFVVLYGSFETHHDAQAALEKLPPALTGASPWLRRFSEIQEGIWVAAR